MELLREGRARPQFGRFVTGWTDHLPRTAYLTAWDLAEAEDPVQETLLRVGRELDADPRARAFAAGAAARCSTSSWLR
jgi:hypothetical protein